MKATAEKSGKHPARCGPPSRPLPLRFASLAFRNLFLPIKQANRPQRPSMLRSALLNQEKSVDKWLGLMPVLRLFGLDATAGNPKTRKPENLEIWKSGNLEIWKSGNLEIRNPKSEIRNPKSEIRNPKSEIRNQKSKIKKIPGAVRDGMGVSRVFSPCLP